jgi:chaperonin cofactor prefoldin
MTTLDEVDRKLNLVIKDLSTIKDELRKVKTAVEEIDSGDAMTYMVGGEIHTKLDEVLRRLPEA